MYRVFLWQTMEVLLLVAAGLSALWGGPAIFGIPSGSGLFWVGLLMALAFMFLYGLAVLGANMMPSKVQAAMGVILWAAAFVGYRGPLGLLPAALGIALALLAGIRPSGGSRIEAVLYALFAYSFPMAGARWLLVPMVAGSQVATGLVWLSGTVYMTGRMLLRIFRPMLVEGAADQPSLVDRPVPDEVAGLLESVSRRRARPYYTAPEGGQREDGISVLVEPERAEKVAARVRAVLGESPLVVEVGQPVDGQVEVVVRQRPQGAATG
ncbi:MAG TPA: hypothetical protein VIL07_05170 [Symbiobacteriaceae bacterium]